METGPVSPDIEVLIESRIKDRINSLLTSEFHTVNGIPTDPHTHDLFFVSRVKAAIATCASLLAGAAVACGIFIHQPLLCVGGGLGFLIANAVAFVTDNK